MFWYDSPYSGQILELRWRTLQVRRELKVRYDFICFDLHVDDTLKHSLGFLSLPFSSVLSPDSTRGLEAPWRSWQHSSAIRLSREACLGTSEPIFRGVFVVDGEKDAAGSGLTSTAWQGKKKWCTAPHPGHPSASFCFTLPLAAAPQAPPGTTLWWASLRSSAV